MVGLSAPPSSCHHRWRYISRRACARIFILRELQRGRRGSFTTYRLSVVIRQAAYAQIAVTTLGWLLAVGLAIAWPTRRWGIKKKRGKQNKTKAGQEQRGAIDYVTEVDGSAIVSTPPAEQNWANTADITIIDVTSRRGMITRRHEHVIHSTS